MGEEQVAKGVNLREGICEGCSIVMCPDRAKVVSCLL